MWEFGVATTVSQTISVPIIAEIDLYKFDPWQLPGNFFISFIFCLTCFLSVFALRLFIYKVYLVKYGFWIGGI